MNVANTQPRTGPIVLAKLCDIHGPQRWFTEASSLGLPPGSFPARLTTDMGNGQDFIRGHRDFVAGEFVGVWYRQLFGCISLLVLND